ncbi:hypothetical protein JCM6882_000012 [Rhodosporidiobolus microsporus]
MSASHTNPDSSFHHQPVDSSASASTPASTTTSNLQPTSSHASHSHSAPSAAAADSSTPASTTSSSDPSVASNASNAGEKKQGVEGAPAASDVGDAGVSGEEGGAGEKGEGGYPPQLHAGKLGLGPSYNTGGGIADTLTAKGEILKGKLTHNPDLVQQGHDRQSGVLQEQYHQEQSAKDEDESPFTRPDDGATEGKKGGEGELPAKGTSESEVRESGHAASASAATAGSKEN